MLRNFFSKFNFRPLPNILALFANDKFREKSKAEILLRLGANTHPYGRVWDDLANGNEFYGHMKMPILMLIIKVLIEILMISLKEIGIPLIEQQILIIHKDETLNNN